MNLHRLSVEQLENIESLAGGGEGSHYSANEDIFLLVAEIRAAWAESEALKEALAAFGNETGPNGNRRCEGMWGTGYACGFDNEGEPIYGFTEFCRYCRARALVGSVPQPADEV